MMTVLGAVDVMAKKTTNHTFQTLDCRPDKDGKGPVLLFTDIVSGPNYGGENNQGAYLSLYGFNFGDQQHFKQGKLQVFIGQQEVGRYINLTRAKPRAWEKPKPLQHLSVQVGHIGNAAAGSSFPITVRYNGICSRKNLHFTVQKGDIYFVDNETGNDLSAQANNINKPWRYIQTSDQKGLISHVKPGDMIIMRGKQIWNDRGYDHRFLRFRHITGTAPVTNTRSGPIVIKSYPGETATISALVGSYGVIHGVSDSFSEDSNWIVLSDLKLIGGDRSVKDGPLNLQSNSNHWRIINNEICCWAAEDGSQGPEARSAAISGNGEDIKILGNYIHDIGGGRLNHGIYLDTGATNIEIAYNQISNVTGGNLIQTYDNLGMKNLQNIKIHHNWLENGNRFGLNISAGTASIYVWNNIIRHTRYAGIRLSSEQLNKSSIDYNTVLETNYGDDRGSLDIDEDIKNGDIYIANNIFWPSSKHNGSSFLEGADITGLQLIHNVFKDTWSLRNLMLHAKYPHNLFCKSDSHCNFINPTDNQDCDCKIIDSGQNYKGIKPGTDFYHTLRNCGKALDIGAIEACPEQ